VIGGGPNLAEPYIGEYANTTAAAPDGGTTDAGADAPAPTDASGN